MVFALFVFTSLIFVTLCIIANDPAPVSTAASAVREVFTGNCRLNCRRPRPQVKGPIIQNLPSVTQTTEPTSLTSKTFKQAIELTSELHNPEQSPGTTNANVSTNGTKTTPSASTPNPTLEVAAPFSQTQSENCVCDTCACALIENLFNKTKPAENVYNNFKEALLNSQVITTLINIYTRLANSYPATLEYLEEDKIDSEENFFFRKSAEGLSCKATSVSKNVNINKRLSIKDYPKSITPTATSSTSNLQNPLTHPTPSHSGTPPATKPILHNEKLIEMPRSGGLTIRENEPPTATLQITPHSIPERRPQSIASIEREIQQFISNGPPAQLPLYTCPSCQSKGVVCVRGCPKENTVKDKDHK